LYQKHFDLGKTRSAATERVMQHRMSVMAQIMSLTIDIA